MIMNVKPTSAPNGFHLPLRLLGQCILFLASGQSYKHFMLVNYNSRVVPDWKLPDIMTLES